jgi:hypothetical protein
MKILKKILGCIIVSLPIICVILFGAFIGLSWDILVAITLAVLVFIGLFFSLIFLMIKGIEWIYE